MRACMCAVCCGKDCESRELAMNTCVLCSLHILPMYTGCWCWCVCVYPLSLLLVVNSRGGFPSPSAPPYQPRPWPSIYGQYGKKPQDHTQIRVLEPQEVLAAVSLHNKKLPATVHISVSFEKPGAGELAQVCSYVLGLW